VVQSRIEGGLLLDPSADETYREDGGVLLAYMANSDKVHYFLQSDTRIKSSCYAVKGKGVDWDVRVRFNMQVTQLVVRGRWPDAELKEALELSMGGCAQLDGAVRQCLIEGAAKE
jgi:exosome complex component MTR3